jgi:1-acyl-sn-glycerol-3-phosphate acyltransferase
MVSAAVRLLLRRLSLFVVRLYYPGLRVEGAERIPTRTPVMFVLNHPNGLLDPLVLGAALGRPVRFLAKHTLFGNPFGRLAMEAFGCFPVYRSQDTGGVGAPAKNEETFARCRQALRDGHWLALFPEGASHSDPQLRPLKTGAARIAIGAEREAEQLGLVILPVGLSYEQKAIFRSNVLLVVGKPLVVAEWVRSPEAAADRQAVDDLTDAVRTALDEVVLQAETRELLEGIARVAAWTADAPNPAPADVATRARALVAAYTTLREKDPERVEAVVQKAQAYARILRRLGVKDPWALEYQRVKPGRAVMAVGTLLLLAPVALVGAILGYLPYRLAGWVAARLTKEEDVLGTVKLLGGALFLLLGWLGEALLVFAVSGGRETWALATLFFAPIASYVALRFGEAWAATIEAVRHLWLRGAHFASVRRLGERRQALASEISRALRDLGPGAAPAPPENADRVLGERAPGP